MYKENMSDSDWTIQILCTYMCTWT